MTESHDEPNEKDSRRHLPVAVALGYEPGTGSAPKVVAGGRGAVAEQILEIAFAHGVKVREDANLAELLSAIDIDSDIPAEAFAAVAEILVYVYRANGRLDDLMTTSDGTTEFSDAARQAAKPEPTAP